MSRLKADGVIKNIIREVVRGCASKGEAVSETLVAFMVKAVVLDPRNRFNVDRTLTKQDVQKLIELCVDRLLDLQSPTLDTIKMQVYFDMNYTSRSEFLKEHQRALQAKLVPQSREITDSRARTREALEDLYRNMVGYVLQLSGLGSSTDINNVREATAALQSVFPQAELGTFMSLCKMDKEQQLNELTTVVTGIRLFNKDCRKGGEGIKDLPAVLNEAVPAMVRSVEEELGACQEVVWRHTALLEQLTEPERVSAPAPVLLDPLKQCLYNSRQHQAFLSLILADVQLCARQVESLQTGLTARLRALKAVVQSKTAVPTAEVFPHFTALAKLWAGLQDEEALLSMLSNVVSNLQPFLSAQSRLLPPGRLDMLLEGLQVKSDLDRMSQSSEDRVDSSGMRSFEWFFPETTANFGQLPLQYRGLCGFTLVKRDGLLLPGNPAIGVLKQREKYYAFASKEAAWEFAHRADEFVVSVAELAKRQPELIQLLELQQQFDCIPPYSEMQSGERLLVRPIIKNDSSTQTDTHLQESNIVKSYEWNEWELRRKAIKLANLQNKVTHSMQTNLSHMRRANSTQTYQPKDAANQTKTDGHSNVPKPLIYLAGLRGGETKTTHMTKLSLTRAVDE